MSANRSGRSLPELKPFFPQVPQGLTDAPPALDLRSLFSLTPSELGRHESPGRGVGIRARRGCGTPTGSNSRGRASNRRNPRGPSPRVAPPDRRWATSRSNRPPTSPDTTPIRSRACQITQNRSLSVAPLRGFLRPNSCRTRRNLPTPARRYRRITSSWSPLGRGIPTGPPWASGRLAPRLAPGASSRASRRTPGPPPALTPS
jgi:hypothetical protein